MSGLAGFLRTWRPPLPRDRESLHHFSFRCALTCFAWLVLLGAVELAGALAVGRPAPGTEPTWQLVTFAFALPMLMGMALLAGLLLAIRGVREFLFRRNWRYEVEMVKSMPMAFRRPG